MRKVLGVRSKNEIKIFGKITRSRF
jgi:hypothetical protein